MAGTIVIQAAVEEDLNEEEQTELKRELEDSLENIEQIEPPEVFYKQQTGTRAFGFVVDSGLDKLAENPAEGRYLAIFIRDSEEEIISEKFILNPALKMEKGRFGMAMSILQRNGVKEVLLPGSPSGQQEMVLKELGMDYRVADFKKLEELREK
ncbi:MAG: hypothetical protein ACQEP7_02470 [bacterium]